MVSIKGNIFLNVVNTVVGLLFPLITFPYVSRILLPEGIGIIQFYQSIINYIVLLSALGIPLYAVREIARHRDNHEIRNRITVEILLLHALLSTLGYIVVFILILSVSKIHSDWPLFLILSLAIFFNVIGANWFYQGVEDFKFITIRSLIFRVLSLAALFIFVRSKSDLYAYAIILVAGQVGNYLINFVRLRKYSVFSCKNWRDLRLFPHLKASFKIFILNVAISLYVNINPVMLGFLSSDVFVGYYTAVTRIISAVNGLTLALGTAILPRLSNYYSTGRLEDYDILKKKALNVICLMCMPISIGLIVVAPILIPVFSGEAYFPSIITLQISAPTLLVSAMNNIIAIQILYTQNKEKLVIVATIIGGIINIILNILLIPLFKQNGCALSGLCAELSVFMVCFISGRKFVNYNLWNQNNRQILLASLLCGIICWVMGKINMADYLVLTFQIVSAGIIYVLILLLSKNDLCKEYTQLLLNKVGYMVKKIFSKCI